MSSPMKLALLLVARWHAVSLLLPSAFCLSTTAFSSKPISVTVHSDISVPWCHVANKRLARAIEKFHKRRPDKPVRVVWKSLEFDCTVDPQGEPLQAYCSRRFGGSTWTRHMRNTGARDGATFQDWQWWPNSQKAHALIEFAQAKGGVDAMKASSVLFDALYEEGENVSLIGVLVRLGVERLGLPAAPLREHLDNFNVQEYREKQQKARVKHSISRLPFFLVVREDSGDLPYRLSGAQSTGTFLAYLVELSKEDALQHQWDKN